MSATAEQRGYAKGYKAGRKRRKRDDAAERIAEQRAAFWNAAFLAALPATMAVKEWTRGGEHISTLTDRVALATEAADAALKHFKVRLR